LKDPDQGFLSPLEWGVRWAGRETDLCSAQLEEVDERLCCLNWIGVGLLSVTDAKPYRHRFPMTIIQQAVWLYHRFPLSCRDVQQRVVASIAR
jgi:hypothetical protein